MGCECSQTNSIVPQQPHVIEESHLKNEKLEDTHYELKKNQHNPQPVLPHSKENRKPKESSKAKQNENDKRNLEKKAVSQVDIGGKPQKNLADVPMTDCTNLEKAVIGVQKGKSKFNNVQKAVNARFEYKIEKESLVGPSSKTIEIVEQQKKQPKQEGRKVNEAIKVQEFAVVQEHKQQVQSKIQSSSKIKIKSVKVLKEGSQKSVNPNDNFTLEHWQKNGEEQDLSRTQRLRRVDQMQIQREQVTNYLNSVWDYEKKVLNSIIQKLQVQQHKKFEQSLEAIK